MKHPFQLLRRCISLIPISLMVLVVGVLLLLSVFTAFLLPNEPQAAESDTKGSSVSSRQLSSINRRYRIRLHLTGPGRANNWAAEQVRQFQFVQQLQYSNDITSESTPSFTERRTLDRHRFLLVSAPLDQSVSLDWGVTDILQSLGSDDDVLPVGENGYPIGPIEPEKLTDQERSRLMNFIRGDRETPAEHNRIIRFISPYEGATFSLQHQFSGRVRSTSFTKENQQISGMERDILLNAPVVPERFIPSRFRGNDAEHSAGPLPDRAFSIRGIDQYLQSFFPCRLTGEAKLRLSERDEDQFTFTGSGSFNILHPSRSQQIGKLRLLHMKFIYQRPDDRIREGELKGRIAISSFPDQHVLNRIKFLRQPSFRISYHSAKRDKHE